MRMQTAAALVALALLPLSLPAGDDPAPAAAAAYQQALSLDKAKKPDEALAAFITAIEADPDFFIAHDALQKFKSDWSFAAYNDKALKPQVDAMVETIRAKYEEWQRRFPDSTGILYGVGSQLYAREDPGARDYLLQVIDRQPDMARPYYMLSMDAARWGNEQAKSDYMHRASQLEPDNADYAFYYASGLREVAPEEWWSASLDVARRFPDSERGAQALYWLGERAPDDARRIKVWEKLRVQFPPEKFRWSAGAMSGLFEAYLRVNPPAAVAFAGQMRQAASGAENDAGSAKEWEGRATLARTFMEVSERIAAGEAAPMDRLDALTPDRFSSNAAMLRRFKAEAMAAAGEVRQAYESLIKPQAATPDDETLAALQRLGAGLDRTPEQVSADVAAARDATAREAPGFDLEKYTSSDTVSLEGLRGKVVFVTFWFPGCGPCRAEFPHFETVVRRFRNQEDLVYLGINGIRDQDEYVLPFMKGTQYSFTPLKGSEAVTGQEGYKVRGYPSNFLIDRRGRIVYSGFRTHDAHSELVLQRMIESLL